MIFAGEETFMRTTPEILNASNNLFAIMSVERDVGVYWYLLFSNHYVLRTMTPKDISM